MTSSSGPTVNGFVAGSPARTGRSAVLLAAGLTLLGVVGTVALWQALHGYERQQIHRTAEAVAEGLAQKLEARLEAQVKASRALAGFWVEHRFVSRARWTDDSRLYARNNHFASLAWIDPGRTERWVATPRGTPAPVAANPDEARAVDSALRLAAREGIETQAGPFRTELGGHALWMAFPVRYRDREPGLLIATLAIDSFLDRFLTARAQGYSVSLRHAGGEFYRRGEPAPDARAAVFSLALPAAAWSGSVQPTSELLARETTPLPEIVLAAGLLISALLGVAAWLAHLAHGRARALSEANREISREVATTRSAEVALRKLNADLEARVEARTAELRELVSELEAFNYSVSHDLRSPLGAVLNFASILDEDYREVLNAKGRDYLNRITSSAESALSLMDGLLTFSRLGREELRRSFVDVGGLVREVVAELTARPSEGEPQVGVGPLPPVHADAAMLRVVFSNVISNALKFSRSERRSRIEIGASEGDGEIVYHVKDNGVGFDPRLAHKLFSVFERLHPREEFAGTGVGLATAARIVHRHGGRIWAEGAPGEGASFYFALPKREGT